jgi:hypothetical protein
MSERPPTSPGDSGKPESVRHAMQARDTETLSKLGRKGAVARKRALKKRKEEAEAAQKERERIFRALVRGKAKDLVPERYAAIQEQEEMGEVVPMTDDARLRRAEHEAMVMARHLVALEHFGDTRAADDFPQD